MSVNSLPLSTIISLALLLASIFASWYNLKERVAVLHTTLELSLAGLAARVEALEERSK